MSHSRNELYAKGYSDGFPKGVDTDRLIRVYNNYKCSNLLDIGGGTGDFLVFCREKIKGLDVSLVDISLEAVEKAKEKGIKGYQVDAGDKSLPFDDNYFDGIHCGDVIEHVFDTDVFLDEVLRVVKPGGVIVMTTPNLAFWFNRLALLFGIQSFHMHLTSKEGGHIRVFTYKRFVKFLNSHDVVVKDKWGYGINTYIGFGKRMKPIAVLANIMTSLIPSLASHMTLVFEKRQK